MNFFSLLREFILFEIDYTVLFVSIFLNLLIFSYLLIYSYFSHKLD